MNEPLNVVIYSIGRKGVSEKAADPRGEVEKSLYHMLIN
jgi:hypothetical protein